jgi:hypothetical protein
MHVRDFIIYVYYEVKSSAVKGGKSGHTLKGTYGW